MLYRNPGRPSRFLLTVRARLTIHALAAARHRRLIAFAGLAAEGGVRRDLGQTGFGVFLK